ncbi:DNA replication/repair protein RecF [Alkalibacter rhizosphaerae]|uniref:DNA replication and repair protein RecF n=1 Tax=Alkalibacter rhizosphaerae TaxID=2815577 RepID=A0A975AHG1_9FIRM|nr:DNA replication/repair protein RecF [Alkalibacter rhizosphaerae]QSX07584.1 DNA replication/repair protein RecF [Alkalibacter rhizosphaerae]
MHLEKLKLYNFRNYPELEVFFHDKMNLILGENGQGKTNLLESIYFLSRGRSFRNPNRELVKTGEEKAFVDGIFVRNDTDSKEHVQITMNYGLSAEGTSILLNRKKLKSRSELAGKILIVDFTPEDLSIVKDGPDKRRRFIDNELLNIKPVHGAALKEYGKILRQRNELLKTMQRDPSVKDTLFVWDERLVKTGKKILFNRIGFMQKINGIAKEIHENLTDGKEALKLYYYSNLIKNNDDLSSFEEIFRQKLDQNLSQDIRRGSTSAGPHLDDIKININDMDAKTYGSQGQKRTCALSLKLSQTSIIKEETGEDAIVLLDDVMSELDGNRQQRIMEHFKDNQIVITSTEISFLDQLPKSMKKIYNVKSGKLY